MCIVDIYRLELAKEILVDGESLVVSINSLMYIPKNNGDLTKIYSDIEKFFASAGSKVDLRTESKMTIFKMNVFVEECLKPRFLTKEEEKEIKSDEKVHEDDKKLSWEDKEVYRDMGGASVYKDHQSSQQPNIPGWDEDPRISGSDILDECNK